MTQTLPLWKNGKEDEQLNNHVLSDVDIEEPAPDTMVNRQTESSESDRPQRTRTIPKRFDDYVLATTNETIPKDYEEAIACEDKKHWENAMLEEIQNMYSHQVWELVPRPVNAKVVKSKWVFKISKDQENKTYKARLVAMGYNQIPGRDYNESFSPVIKNATLRTILSMAATKDSVIKLFDVKAAYLNGNIENTIFMEQPAGFVQDRNKVCKLNKSIYGLPQSGRSWYEKFSQVLHDCGLEKLKSDPCLFKWKNEDKYFYVGIYVDDFITVSNSEDTSNRFINKLRHHLEIKDVTCKGMFLGIKIIQDKEGISLQQSHYVQQILQKYGMENCKEVPTPGSKEINLDNHIEDDNCDQHTYQEALGMLMFLAVNTRPDIAYITSKLSQYSRQPKQMHWTAIKRVMRYLRGTIDLGVKFERGKTGILKSYADASWSTTHDGKSYGGYVLKLGEATIDWKSSKQPLVALSTMEAEMIAACESCCQIKWIINLLRELEEWNFMEKPTAIYTDSQSLINWISSPKQSSRCRHINRKYHFLRDCYESRDICLLYKPSQDLEADIFTKDLSRDQMKKHLESLSIVGIKPKIFQCLISTLQLVERLDRYPLRNKRKIDSVEPEETSMNVKKEGTQDDGEDLSSMIRQIVREEVQRALGSTREEPKISTIEDMVKEEIGRTLAPISKPRRSSPQKERPREFYNNRYVAHTIRPHPEPRYPKEGGRRDTNEWRTTEEDQEDQLEEDPEDDSTNFQEEDIPTVRTQQPQTREEISGPITRSRALRLRITISRRLVANGLHSCRPLRRLPLTPPNRRQRLEWCRARSTWMTEWHRVVFSYESRFCLSSDSRRVRVWRRRGERSNPAAIVERPTVRQRGIMVWGAIAYDSRSPLLRIQGTMTAQRYVDDVLRPVTLPYLQGVPNALYQQDNARPHTARISQQALQDLQMLPWPPYSPDLSPIEHVWDIIRRRLHALPQPRSEDELWQMWVNANIEVHGDMYELSDVQEEKNLGKWSDYIEVMESQPGGQTERLPETTAPARQNNLGRRPNIKRNPGLLELSLPVKESIQDDQGIKLIWGSVEPLVSVKEVAEDQNISIGSCHSIFINDLGMRRVAAKFVPKLLNCDQKQHRMNIANEMLYSVRDDPNLLQRVITGDEAWVYGYDVETKVQSSQWKLPHEPRPKKARQVRSNVKVLLTVFFDCRGVVHHEFLPQGRTVNKEYYLQVMRNLREAIRQKRPNLRKNKNWLLHHDNAPAPTSLLVRDLLAKNNTLMMPRSHRIPQIWPPVTFSCSLN
ncbi:hypothetical protein LAZ67_4001938 [Cordylochernes scorpioides]|uniref:Uncharacterized protein n=1 Tax=Cordylochernes scorpioides TaxID=51811 RepID=A0ABY6KCK4_9ARAC|nr:hypothetical protein LAZ67_4001938 [Cordylochernes scorpioides]